ncbi:hypothetical protein MP228_003278 [Amoeboaphelidium protococcarum]|nr:hypothetical protein MP228_003278 [Amoeboaphelidium protococcarum]
MDSVDQSNSSLAKNGDSLTSVDSLNSVESSAPPVKDNTTPLENASAEEVRDAPGSGEQSGTQSSSQDAHQSLSAADAAAAQQQMQMFMQYGQQMNPAMIQQLMMMQQQMQMVPPPPGAVNPQQLMMANPQQFGQMFQMPTTPEQYQQYMARFAAMALQQQQQQQQQQQNIHNDQRQMAPVAATGAVASGSADVSAKSETDQNGDGDNVQPAKNPRQVAQPQPQVGLPYLRPVQCYCNNPLSLPYQPPIRCVKCNRFYHPHCIPTLVEFGILLGDDYYQYECQRCTSPNFDIQHYLKPETVSALEGDPTKHSYPEVLKRLHVLWADINHLVLYHLTHTHHLTYFQWKQHLCTFVEQNWHRFFYKQKPPSISMGVENARERGETPKYGEPWHSSIASALSSNSPARFICSKHQDSSIQLQSTVPVQGGQVGWWALTDPSRYPADMEAKRTGRLEGVIYKGRIVEMPSELIARKEKSGRLSLSASSVDLKEDANGAKKSGTSKKENKRKSVNDANVSEKKPKKKKVKKEISPDTPIIKIYPDLPNPSTDQGTVRMSNQSTHSAQQFKFSSDGLTIWNEKGYRLCKASHGVDEGIWYFECEILPKLTPKSNLRIGWSQISGDLQAPCGFDSFSYSFRSDPPSLFHQALGVADYSQNEQYQPGDILGVMICLPPLRRDADGNGILESAEGAACDPLPGYWDGRSQYQAVSYRLPRPVCKGSWIRYFINGQDLGIAFKDLYYGKYYPAVSSYMGGTVRMNFGDDSVGGGFSIDQAVLDKFNAKGLNECRFPQVAEEVQPLSMTEEDKSSMEVKKEAEPAQSQEIKEEPVANNGN